MLNNLDRFVNYNTARVKNYGNMATDVTNVKSSVNNYMSSVKTVLSIITKSAGLVTGLSKDI